MSESKYKAVIFDLDGVIVTTDDYHYQAWKTLADRESIHFDRAINERLRGVGRRESLDIILEKSDKKYTDEQKNNMTDEKNAIYRDSLNALTSSDILPGVTQLLHSLKARGVKIAIGSSSRNTPTILDKIGLGDFFDTVVDGNMISRSKPDPEVFLSAAKRLNEDPRQCVVIEDADAGIASALSAGCKAVGVGAAAENLQAHMRILNLSNIDVDALLSFS